MPGRVRLMPTTAVRVAVRDFLKAALQEVAALVDASFMFPISTPFTPGPNLSYGDFTLAPTRTSFAEEPIDSDSVFGSKDTRQGDYLVSWAQAAIIAWKSAGGSAEVTIHGFALIGEADSTVFASFLYDDPITINANNQWIPPFEWTVRLPISFFE